MLDYGSVRNVFKKVDRLAAKNRIIAEWNMNKYQRIASYGIYCNPAPHNPIFTANDGDISLGQNHLLYTDNSTLPSPEQEYVSQVASIFRPNQPDPGIILMQKYNTTLMIKNSTDLKIGNVSPNKPRYYPFTEFRRYDYFNSAKKLKTNSGYTVEGVSNTQGGIRGASPFVVYENTFPCNKITIKVQNHLSVPQKFSIEVLVGTSWVTAYNLNQSSSADFANGILNIYYNGSSWVKVSNSTEISPYVVTDLNEVSLSTPSQLMKIKGVRLSVHQMSVASVGGRSYPAGLEILELSPKLEIDLSEYTENFSFNSSIGDQTSFGLPVGDLVSSTGGVSLSNEGNQFLFSSTLSSLRMLSPDVKFSFFQIVDTSESTSSIIPLKVLYSVEWSIGEDYSVSVSLEDGFKFLREISAFDILVRTSIGIPLSSALLFLLDNSGINGFNFIKSSPDALGEDTTIRNFFCKREQTVAEVLEELAVATQCAMYFDARGKLTVLTKERLSKKVNSVESNGSNSGTDMWMVFDEDYYLSNSSSVSEFPYISGYNANVISYREGKVNPITDGEIVYHVYGPNKVAGLESLSEGPSKRLLEETVFPAGLAFTNFQYATRIVWTPGETNDAAFGAANLIKDLSSNRIKNVFTGTYTAVNEDSAIRGMFNSATDEQKKSLVIYMDKNEGLLFGPYKGHIFIDGEFIRYNGKLYHFDGLPAIIFSDEEFSQKLRELSTGTSITFIGLIIDVEFENIGQNGDKYDYKVIGDGRAKMGTRIEPHYAFVEEGNPILNTSNRYGIQLGGTSQLSQKPTAQIRYNFLERGRYKAVYRALKKSGLLNRINPDILRSYLGFLKLEGVKNSADSALVDRIGTDPIAKVKLDLATQNAATDNNVPGNFDEFVYLNSERNIYAQRMDIPNFDGQPFIPNVVSTRMRLYSPRRTGRNEQQTMETVSSIAGLGVNINPSTGEGYYLEVEGVGSGKSDVASEAFINTLRFYKVFKNSQGQYQPYLIFSAPVGAFTVSNIDVQVLKAERTADPVFELTVVIKQTSRGKKFIVRYGDTVIGSFLDTGQRPNASDEKDPDPGPIINGNDICLFVRGDSQAIYEYITAGVREIKLSDEQFLRRYNSIDEQVKTGIIPLSQQYFYKNNSVKYYYNDFAKLVREVKDYDIRFQDPTFASTLIDVSAINSDYMIKSYRPTAFGAKLVVANTSAGPIILSDNTNNPLYIVGIVLEELSNGSVTMKEFYDQIDEKRRRVITREENKSVYGEQTFTLDSQYMQSLNQARNMMRWITRNCSRQRMKLDMEIFPNPLLELGDKVKVYDKTRGYNENNQLFGQKTFTVSSISYSVSNAGPGMNISLIEVGES